MLYGYVNLRLIMINKNRIIGMLLGWGLFLLLPTNSNSMLAQNKREVDILNASRNQIGNFDKIEQPLSLKIAVALSGFVLICAELRWFIFNNKNK